MSQRSSSSTLIVKSRRSRDRRPRQRREKGNRGGAVKAGEKKTEEEKRQEALKKLQEAEAREAARKAKAEKLKAKILAGFTADLTSFVKSVTKTRAAFERALRLDDKNSYYLTLKRLQALDESTAKFQRKIRKAAKVKAKLAAAAEQKHASQSAEIRTPADAPQGSDKGKSENAESNKTSGGEDAAAGSKMERLVNECPLDLIDEALKIVASRPRACTFASYHVDLLISGGGSPGLIEDLLDRVVSKISGGKEEESLSAKQNVSQKAGSQCGFPICVAARQGQHGICKSLSLSLGERSADFCDRTGHNPILYAAQAGYDLVCKILIDVGAFVDSVDSGRRSALMLACRAESRFFLAEVARRKQVLLAAKRIAGKKKSSNNSKQSTGPAGESAGARNKKSKSKTSKVKKEASSSASGKQATAPSVGPKFRPLRGCKHVNVVKLLVAAGANTRHRDKWGRSVLTHAAECGTHDAVRVLLKSGEVDVNETDSQMWTALHYAAYNGHYDASYFLVAGQANLDAAEEHGITPLMMAVEHDHIRIVKLLLSAGASKAGISNYGRSAVALARDQNNEVMVEILQKGTPKDFDPETFLERNMKTTSRARTGGKKKRQNAKRKQSKQSGETQLRKPAGSATNQTEGKGGDASDDVSGKEISELSDFDSFDDESDFMPDEKSGDNR